MMARTGAVPGLVTVVATVMGGALRGIVAIPSAAAIKLLVEEMASPRLERG
jgi:hypothetical protein